MENYKTEYQTSNCCWAVSIAETDICSACKEHAEFECEHEGEYQPSEPDVNVQESYTCIHCSEDLPIPEPDWDLELKDKKETK